MDDDGAFSSIIKPTSFEWISQRMFPPRLPTQHQNSQSFSLSSSINQRPRTKKVMCNAVISAQTSSQDKKDRPGRTSRKELRMRKIEGPKYIVPTPVCRDSAQCSVCDMKIRRRYKMQERRFLKSLTGQRIRTRDSPSYPHSAAPPWSPLQKHRPRHPLSGNYIRGISSRQSYPSYRRLVSVS